MNPEPPPFYLGCPVWSVAAWKGLIFPAKSTPDEFLALYSRVFNTVEGNSTFYALPKLDTAKRWADAVQPDFRFCFKVPRDISHGPGLMADRKTTQALFEFLDVFAEAEVLGPTFLQLHKSFGPDRLNELDTFLAHWPDHLALTVEVRHPRFFKGETEEQDLDQLLKNRRAGRTLFDSQALYHAPPDDSVERVSQTRKPNLPVRWTATYHPPFLRFVGRNQVPKADPWLKDAAQQAIHWIEAGQRPYLFMHAPEDAFAPELCARFHHWMRQIHPEIPPLDLQAAMDGQLDLFS